MSVSKKTVLGFINGNQEAISKVYFEYKNLMYFVIANYIISQNDADDVFSEAFTKALENKSKIKDTNNLKSYLCSIAKNEAINYLKKEKQIIALDTIDEMYGEDDRHNALLNDIEPLLSNKETIIVYYRAVFDYSWSEIAELTGIPESTARRIYTNAKERLRKELL